MEGTVQTDEVEEKVQLGKELTDKEVKQLAERKAKLAELALEAQHPLAQYTCLDYRLEGSGAEGLTEWGHEYLRSLSGEIAVEYQKRIQALQVEEIHTRFECRFTTSSLVSSVVFSSRSVSPPC